MRGGDGEGMGGRRGRGGGRREGNPPPGLFALDPASNPGLASNLNSACQLFRQITWKFRMVLEGEV